MCNPSQVISRSAYKKKEDMDRWKALEKLPQVYVKGKYQDRSTWSYEIKSISGEILMSGDYPYSMWAGAWSGQRMSMNNTDDGSCAFEMKSESVGCCSGSGMNTEVNSAYGDVIGYLRGKHSHILLTNSSNEVIGNIYGGIFSTD
ncbi:unnamed protein product, partial [Meganyctiphanes norvegica]